MTTAIRLAHFSDIHITAAPLGWKRGDYLTKHFPGWINYRWLGRQYRFRHADEAVSALMAELRQRWPDHLVFSGDATALGFEAEFIRAAKLLGLGEPEGLPGLAVPGNHDYYTAGAVAQGLFERYFAPWQKGQRIERATYPFAQRVGDFWLVGVNSSTANRWMWDASGAVGLAQLDRLERLLAQLDPGPRILVTHYPVCLAGGQRERRSHGLRDLVEVAAVAARGGVCLWLHGHRHGAYHHVQTVHTSFPVVCAGSATQSGLWSYKEYTIEGHRFLAARRIYDPESGRFKEGGSFELTLRHEPAPRP